MRSKLLGFGIPLTAAVVATVGWVRSHPTSVWSRLATQIVQQKSHQAVAEYDHLRQAAKRQLTASTAAVAVTVSRPPTVATTRTVAYSPPSPLTLVRSAKVTGWSSTSVTISFASEAQSEMYRVRAVLDPYIANSAIPIGYTSINDPYLTRSIPMTITVHNLQPGHRYALYLQAGQFHGQSVHWGPSTVLHSTTWTPWSTWLSHYQWSIGETYDRVDNQQGTTFLLTTGQWVTCHHAIRGDSRGPDLTVTLHHGSGAMHGQTEYAAVTGETNAHDLATLTVNHFVTVYQGLTQQWMNQSAPVIPAGIPLNTHPLWIGEPIAIIGHPLGDRLTITTGVLTGKGIMNWQVLGYGTIPYVLTGNAWAAGGSSGSPVLNPWGQVIGVDESGKLSGSHAEGIVPITALKYVHGVTGPSDYPPSFLGGLGGLF